MADGQLGFSFDAPPPGVADVLARDEAARVDAANPAVHIALEASAGTGKTRVLVDRYVNLLRAGVEPRRVLAITFTRKAAAEMRARIVADLTRLGTDGSMPPEVWKDLRGRLSEIAVSTIDAFCLSLLGEFPLEADIDPGFGVADETETPRLMDDALDRTLRLGRAHGVANDEVAWLFSRLGEGRLRSALARLLDRRLVALDTLDRFLGAAALGLTPHVVVARAAARLRQLAAGDRLARVIATGPDADDFRLLADSFGRLAASDAQPAAGAVADVLARLRDYCCTKQGSPRKRLKHAKARFPSPSAYATHTALVAELGSAVPMLVDQHRREVNAVLARALRWMTARAIEHYRRTLDAHAMVDFTDALVKALALLERMEEFSQSRYRLESRYQHVLVDELQDTSRAQWALVELLVRAWGEGAGVAHDGPAPPSLFVVGDRKQSIYGFRDAEVGVLDEAARLIGRLRPDRGGRRAIVRSFRAVPALQEFVNDVCDEMEKRSDRVDAFRYSELDRFPVAATEDRERPVGLVAGADTAACARAVAAEIHRMLLAGAPVRDRDTGVARAIVPGDIAILFRSRDSHREFERELERLGVPFYVYKGLGFFDAHEVKDVLALVDYLAAPSSDLAAAALLRSRFVRLSDAALAMLAPHLAQALLSPEPPAVMPELGPEDRQVLATARGAAARWARLADRLPPADLVDAVLHDSAYLTEIRGIGWLQARENLKKVRALMRRLQNRGYATIGRVAEHLSQLKTGDESNAIVDAVDAVNLMTVHGAKGLEFPVVFVVNLARGSGGRGDVVAMATTSGVDGERDAHVSVDALVADALVEIEAREREETKRLVYVALTRARDRLYLATTLTRHGTFAPASTALGHVLPTSLGQALAAAATEREPWIVWTATSGRRHHCRVVAGHAERAVPVRSTMWDSDFTPLDAGGVAVRSVSEEARAEAPATAPEPSDRAAARSVGALVHAAVAEGALTLEPEGRAAVLERITRGLPTETDARVRTIVERAAARDDLQALFRGADVRHEVPLSWPAADGATVRAVLDAVVRHDDDRLTLLEFKTGPPHPADERQLAAYVEGLRRLAPTRSVAGRIVYLGT